MAGGAKLTASQRPLWKCPRCGARFVTRNLWHSCGRFKLADHFTGKDPIVRKVYERFLAAVRERGPVTVIPQKTRIVIMVRVRFAGGSTRKSWFRGSLWLTRPASHRCLLRAEKIMPNCYVHTFRLERPEDVDEDLKALLREAYAIGCQKHLEPGWAHRE